MSSVSSILGQSEAASTSKTNAYAENKEMFLTLLVTQLSNQDPLDPQDDTEFIAQLAQFTQVEELQKLNEGMTSMVEAYDREQFLSATSLLRTRVLSAGTSVSKVTLDKTTGEYGTTTVYFTSDRDMASCTVNVYGSGGQIIYSEDYGARQADTYSFTWDGTDGNGNVIADGIYEIGVTAKDVNGNSILASIQVFGDVVQVERSEDGEYKLVLYDGRTIKLDDVTVTGYVISNGDSSITEDTENTENTENTETP